MDRAFYGGLIDEIITHRRGILIGQHNLEEVILINLEEAGEEAEEEIERVLNLKDGRLGGKLTSPFLMVSGRVRSSSRGTR